MYRIRYVEEEISRRYVDQEMRCPVHLSIGQEAPAVGVCSALSPKDSLFSTHRCHAHYIAKGGNLDAMIAEIYGKESGCNGGRGGSMHLSDLSVKMNASIPIIGSSIPLAVGDAFSNGLKGNSDISTVIFGDAALEEGVFHECMNFAALKNLNVFFVCENNDFSIYTHIGQRQSNKRRLKDIAKSYGMETEHIEGSDVLVVNKACEQAINHIRSGKGPYFLVIDTFRWKEHCGPSEDDHLGYRNAEEVSYWLDNCSLEKLLSEIKTRDESWTFWYDKMCLETSSEINNSFEKAIKSKLPDSSKSWENIYA